MFFLWGWFAHTGGQNSSTQRMRVTKSRNIRLIPSWAELCSMCSQHSPSLLWNLPEFNKLAEALKVTKGEWTTISCRGPVIPTNWSSREILAPVWSRHEMQSHEQGRSACYYVTEVAQTSAMLSQSWVLNNHRAKAIGLVFSAVQERQWHQFTRTTSYLWVACTVVIVSAFCVESMTFDTEKENCVIIVAN